MSLETKDGLLEAPTTSKDYEQILGKDMEIEELLSDSQNSNKQTETKEKAEEMNTPR